MVLSETKQRRQSQFRGKEKNPRTCHSDKHKDSGDLRRVTTVASSAPHETDLCVFSYQNTRA